MLRADWLLITLVGAATQLSAQESPPRFGRLSRIIPGIQYQVIQRLTGSVDLVFIEAPSSHSDIGDAGVQIGIDLGQGGGKLRVGRGDASPLGGMSFGLGLLRTWNQPVKVGPGQTFVGAELRWDAGSIVALSIGYYLRASGSAAGDGHVVNLGMGFVYPITR